MSRLDSDNRPVEEETIAARQALYTGIDGILKQTPLGSLSQIASSGRMVNIQMGVAFVPEDLEQFIQEQISEDDPNTLSCLDAIEIVHEQSVPSSGLYQTTINLRVTHYPKGIRVVGHREGVMVFNEEGEIIAPLDVFKISERAFRTTNIQLRPDATPVEFIVGAIPSVSNTRGKLNNPGILFSVGELISQPGRKVIKVL